MKMTEEQFNLLTDELIEDHKVEYVERFNNADAGLSACVVVLIEKPTSPEGVNTRIVVASPTHQRSVYDDLTDDIRRDIYECEDKIPVVFMAWNGLITVFEINVQ
ncbi:MAG: hypothetical protein K0S53_371 [Bacteroidetes bacterium]|jgi:hypothetical protein|nr:hypothetical protein [Bacteroidota bacterium]